MGVARLLFLAGSLLLAMGTHAEMITLAAASDLKFAMDDILTSFRQAHPANQVSVVYGSSGKLQTQIQQGAPFDLYFSADIAFAQTLVRSGFAASQAKPYARGRLVLWSKGLDATQMTLTSLADARITRVAIANPQHAPYGRRAQEALRSTGLWETVAPKLVYGDNIAHTAQFVQTGNAQVGIIALSLALSPELSAQGGYWLIPSQLHQPLEQGFIITRRAASNQLARRLADYMDSPWAHAVMNRYGFEFPGAQGGK